MTFGLNKKLTIMKNYLKGTAFVAVASFFLFAACNNPQQSEQSTGSPDVNTPLPAGQSSVQDDESQKNIVQVASGSADHSTLVAAVQAAGLVDVLVNAGPFTVFAPTNAAFDALPAGTVDNLLKPENKDQLSDILQYHVAVAVLKTDYLRDGQKLEMVNGGMITISKNGDQVKVNGANIIGTVEASNGLIHVVDQVLLPQ